MTKKDLLEAIEELFKDQRVAEGIESSKQYDISYDVEFKIIKIKLYDREIFLKPFPKVLRRLLKF